MVRKTQKTTKSTKPSKMIIQESAVTTMTQTNHDLLVSMLIVSSVINLFFLTAWIALQVTTIYDKEVATFLFSR